MRVSQYYKLGRKQPSLMFVDVDIKNDVRLFVSPSALRVLPTHWGAECVYLIQDFFDHLINLIRSGNDEEAVGILSELREPNETHLGLSKGKSKGRALGAKSAVGVWRSFARSNAVKSGLVTDLEDTVLMIHGISVDIISDIVTNIIREPLIRFTQDSCEFYGIKTIDGVDSGPIWNPKSKSWERVPVSLPLPQGEKLILIPKEIVRQSLDIDVGKYYRNFILEHLKQEELASSSSLVRVIKDRRKRTVRKVYKKDLREKYGDGKDTVVDQTLRNPHLLRNYKKTIVPSKPMGHLGFSGLSDDFKPDWARMLRKLKAVKPGRDMAVEYESRVEELLSALFSPVLAHPQKQSRINHGRKIVDISYSNMASEGFFKWLAAHQPCSNIFFECKNYGREIGNPELDQISGRFSPNRGKFGIIVCRSIKNKERFAESCRDTANDGRGFVVWLDDDDLEDLVESAKSKPLTYYDFDIIKNRYDQLVM